ncbi:HAD-IIB family hydrolase [Planctomycetaceae bacterium SH139]
MISAKFLLISDLDDTLLGDDLALARFAEFYAVRRDSLSLVYASGRFFETIQRDVQQTALPEPVAVIGGVGSEIRDYPAGQLNQTWVDRISAGWSAQQVRQLLADHPQLELQPESAQSDFKVSYYFDNAKPDQLDQLKQQLSEHDLDVSIVYSSARDLDFLPAQVDKGTAAAFIAQQLGYAQNRVIVAGNSGNDSRLFEHDFGGVIVANAHEELKQLGDRPRAYLSTFERADGVRDGLQYWMQLESPAVS